MFLCGTRRPLHCALGVSLCLLLVTLCCDGQYQMVGPSSPVLAMLGGDVVLSCQLEPAADVSDGTVEWTRPDLRSRFVLLRRDGVELLYQQNPWYVGRTRLSVSRLKHGELSLELSNVKLSDRGTYRCHVPGKGSTEVHLHVGSAPQNVAISAEADESSGGVALGCQSAGWYPEPELLWLDSEGNPVPAGPPQTLAGPDGLYSVSSRMRVEKRGSYTFSCRVQQSNISQSATTQLTFTVENLQDASCPAARVVMVVVSAFVVLSLLVCWKLKVHRRTHKEPPAEEDEALVEQRRGMDVRKLLETMKKEEEEEKDLEDVIEWLKKWEEEMKESRRQQDVQLREVEEKITETDKKLRRYRTVFGFEKSEKTILILEKEELKRKRSGLETSSLSTASKLQTLEKMVLVIIKQKEDAGTKIQTIRQQIAGRQEDDRKQGRSQTEETAESANTEDPPVPPQEVISDLSHFSGGTCETDTRGEPGSDRGDRQPADANANS